MLGVSLFCFVVGEWTGNNSQVDKLWSVVPILYIWMAAEAFDFHPRTVLMAVMVTFWGARLTFNFARRGAYSWKFWEGEEDYRWPILRSKPFFNKRWKWTLFNFGFICLYQNTLILLFCLPILLAANGPLGIWDLVLSIFFLGVLLLEFIADQQQWNFHKEKNRLKKAGEVLPEIYAKGFVAEGLWSKSRHPNYTAEQSIWLVFYLFSVVATGQWLNWSITGFLLLLLLFQGSSDFSEEISSSKYPAYKEYQKRVGRFLPKLF
jgi:steroid 5-alpha reductase family enzyme